MNDIKHTTFHLFRYQILPISQTVQLSFDPPVSSVEELRKRKNEYFADIVRELPRFTHSRAEIVHKISYDSDDLLVIRLAANRSLRRSKRDFTEEKLDNWPSLYVALNNDPDVQLAAIQKAPGVFYRTSTVANILEESLDRPLRRYQLTIRFMPLFEQRKFWDIVTKYPADIVETDFEMISPNMANISQGLSLDLGELNRRTNTQETHLQLKCDSDTHLTLSEDDSFIASLVEYASQGAGNIIVKVRGVRRRFQTANSVTETSIDSAILTGPDADRIAEAFREILK